jgi:hypothetical protein
MGDMKGMDHSMMEWAIRLTATPKLFDAKITYQNDASH